MFNSFHRWLDRALRVDAYELRGEEIVSTGLPRRCIKPADIRAWRSYYIGGGVPSVEIAFADGQTVDYTDKQEHLFRILHEIAAARELPFWTV